MPLAVHVPSWTDSIEMAASSGQWCTRRYSPAKDTGVDDPGLFTETGVFGSTVSTWLELRSDPPSKM